MCVSCNKIKPRDKPSIHSRLARRTSSLAVRLSSNLRDCARSVAECRIFAVNRRHQRIALLVVGVRQ
jgi:hypothetical protein